MIVSQASGYVQTLRQDGYAVVNEVVDEQGVFVLREAIAAIPERDEVRRKANVYGVRNLLEVCPEVRDLAGQPLLLALVAPILGDSCFAVRATFFDKVEGANWNLRWHQDGVISVLERVETPGFTAWAQKANVWQVRPPVQVLFGMLAIRVYLDDCPVENGALRFLAGSHRRLWAREDIPACKEEFREVTPEVERGGIVAMRPLTLHASSPAETPEHRRVIHIEYASEDLPGGLEWRSRITG